MIPVLLYKGRVMCTPSGTSTGGGPASARSWNVRRRVQQYGTHSPLPQAQNGSSEYTHGTSSSHGSARRMSTQPNCQVHLALGCKQNAINTAAERNTS
jgi:hypothetical protein